MPGRGCAASSAGEAECLTGSPDSFRIVTWSPHPASARPGVKNAVAQRHMRACSKGDLAFIYHTAPDKAIVGGLMGYRPDDERLRTALVNLLTNAARHTPAGGVEGGSALVNHSGERLTEIVSSVKRVTDLVAEMASATRSSASANAASDASDAPSSETMTRNPTQLSSVAPEPPMAYATARMANDVAIATAAATASPTAHLRGHVLTSSSGTAVVVGRPPRLGLPVSGSDAAELISAHMTSSVADFRVAPSAENAAVANFGCFQPLTLTRQRRTQRDQRPAAAARRFARSAIDLLDDGGHLADAELLAEADAEEPEL